MESLPIELRQAIVTIPWIKHLNLYVCKEWYQFIYDNLPGVDLEQYIIERDYFAIKYIRLNFRYKFLELANIKVAIIGNDSIILKLIISNMETAINEWCRMFCADKIETLSNNATILLKGLINNSNHKIIKYFAGTNLSEIVDYESIYPNIDKFDDLVSLNLYIQGSDYLSYKSEQLIINKLSTAYTKFCVRYRKEFSFEHHFPKNVKNKIKFKRNNEEKAYFECIRHGFFNIINSINDLRIMHRTDAYAQMHFPLALTGTCKTKYMVNYIDYDGKFSRLLVNIMNLQDRYEEVLK